VYSFVGYVKARLEQTLQKLGKERLNVGNVAHMHSDQREDLCDPVEIEYITTRELQNSHGSCTGKIRMIVLKGENEASIDLTCPECGFSEKKKEIWKKPFTTNCGRCGFLIKITSLKAEIKKERKAR